MKNGSTNLICAVIALGLLPIQALKENSTNLTPSSEQQSTRRILPVLNPEFIGVKASFPINLDRKPYKGKSASKNDLSIPPFLRSQKE